MKKHQSSFQYKSYTGSLVTQTFQCLDCGCLVCFRHKRDYHLTFFEGHFHCQNCKKEVCYADDDFIRVEQKTPKQLQLF